MAVSYTHLDVYKRQPLFVELEITDTEPGFKGDTATGASKMCIRDSLIM